MTVKEVEVLLVEDNPNDQELTLRALKRKNLCNRIHVVGDGAEALDFLFGKGQYAGRTTADLPKVVLLDIKLPKINGIEVLQKVKADPVLRTLPIVMLTSSKEGPDVQECYRLGANSYIVKPVDFDKFTEAVVNLGFYWLLTNEPPK
ncbi:MAG TPA: response regulator [Planctomycetota bacterium]|nr:response regulator [Planctomycetota bacterium]